MNLNFRLSGIILILLLGLAACNSTNRKAEKAKGVMLKSQLRTSNSST
ncbi:hypothetical protein MNBD_BACTEROID07-2047 [hydrothermal vent metagenome]|uniref:Lipoprotein n=1 Tax=hydrothermal vent metagenome TaxID=652676 RepID=A0A3B0UDF2_9ZZZZ